MKVLAVIALSLALLGCGTKQVVAIPDDAKKVNLDPRLLQDCPPLPKAKSSRDGDLLDNSKEVIDLYAQCASDKKALNREVKKAFNLP